ncbi:MAG: glucokinase [Usitatibacter sp.]
MILAGDVGATKILLEVGEARSGKWFPKLARRYSTAEAANFSEVLTAFLGEWNVVRGKGERIEAAGFGVAGPQLGNKVKMTHRPLTVDGEAIEARFLIPKVRVVNDLAAAAHGIEWLGPRDLVTIQAGKAAPNEPRVVMGVGTGLGIAYLVPDGEGGFRELAGEGGHAGFAPVTVQQAELWRALHQSHGRASAEDVVSGTGLVHVYSFMKNASVHAAGEAEDQLTAEWIAERAAKGDLVSTGTLDLFFECMGSVAGDHALSVMARGGVFLTGGVVARLHGRLRESRFSEFFCSKGAFSATMMKIPVRAITGERTALLGAARLAL